jgi:hypothetical protein
MIDITELFSTQVLTSKEFLKILYGLIYISTKLPVLDNRYVEYSKICLYIYTYRRFQEAICINVSDSYNQILLENSIREICNISDPRYTATTSTYSTYRNLLASGFSGSTLEYLARDRCAFYIDSQSIHLQFPSARERLEIPQYLISTLGKLEFQKKKALQSLIAVYQLKSSNTLTS